MRLECKRHETICTTHINIEIHDGPEYNDQRTGQLHRVVSVNWTETDQPDPWRRPWINVLAIRIKKDGYPFAGSPSRIFDRPTEELVREQLRSEGWQV